MCKWNKWGDTRIDPCMKILIKSLNQFLRKDVKILACCCGHGKYPMTIVCESQRMSQPFEIVSNKFIPRKKKFYKRDKQRVYYIPEVQNV